MGRHSATDDDEADVAAGAPVQEDVRPRGRHSRPEDTEQTGPLAPLPDEQPTDRIGLGLVAELLDEAPTAEAAPGPEVEEGTSGEAVTGPAQTPPAEAPEAPEAPKPPQPGRGREHSTAADLALLRSRPDLRARCIAAVVAPFVLYLGAMLIVGAERVQYLLWLWIPLILGLALAGNFLDLAYKRQRAQRADGIDDQADGPA